MSFNASNPLSHLGVRAQRPPEQYLKQSRDPTPDDYQNFVIGDEWRNNNTNVWWKLCDIQGNVALWDKYAGPGSGIETITTGDSAVVVPDSNENVNFVNGNGVGTTGSGSSVTYNMVSPFTGDFNFTGQVGVGSLALADSDAPSGYARVMKTGVKQLNADGVITILKGAQLSGMGCLSWEGPSRMHTIWFYISTSTGDTGAPMSQICQETLNAQYIFTNFMVATDGVDMAIQCTVGNRNGGTGNAVLTWYGDAKHPVDTDVTLFPVSFTSTSFIDTYGYYVEGAFGFPVLRGLLNATTGQPTVATFENFSYGTAGNDMGVGFEFRHQQANGNQVIGSKIYTKCPDSGTNVQTTDLYFQNNVASVVTDTARLLSTGEFDAGSFGLPNLASSGWGKVIANFTINVTADGLYTIASGTRLSGIFKFAWNFPAQSRINEAVVQVSTVQNDNGACLSILSNRPSQSQEVLQEFCIAQDAGGIPALQVRIGNRNGSTGNLIVTWYGDSAYPDDGTQVDLAPAGYVAASYVDYGGLQCDMNENLGGAIKQDAALSFPADVLVAQHTLKEGVGAPANMGASLRLDHEQADGTIVQGLRLYTEAPDSNTNVQSTDAYLQLNSGGSLVEVLKIDHNGQITNDINSTGLPGTYYPFNLELQNLAGTCRIWLQSYDSIGAPERYFFGFGVHTEDGDNLITDADSVNNGGTGILGWIEGTMSFYGIASTGGVSKTVAVNSLQTVDVDPSGYCHAYSFVTKTATTFPTPTLSTPPSGAWFFHEGSATGSHSWQSASTTTANATPTTIATIAFSTNSAITVRAIISCKQDTSASAGGGTVLFTARRAGAGAILVGAAIVNFNEDVGGATITGNVSGNDAIIQVTGVAATNLTWDCDYEVHTVG